MMRFRGSDDGSFSNQAFLNQSPSDVGPIFFAGFAKPETGWSFGSPISYGNGNRGQGLMVVTLDANQHTLYAFEFNDAGATDANGVPVAGSASSWVALAQTTPLALGAWHHVALAMGSASLRKLTVDGVMCADTIWTSSPLNPQPVAPATVPWPTAPTRVTFGALYSGGPDAHSFNGCLADWCLVSGAPLTTELTRHLGGESPVSIWGARVLGWWRFNRLVTGQVPNEIVGGTALSLLDAGTAVGHALPQIVTA